ncbi:unnamed protein product [Ilex paraguariensis]|uniref:Uncharacterized protein n=1 Tax=Ilex paraguariensis TaxID=185542 RepID=A0ABC8U4E6_9AQUA
MADTEHPRLILHNFLSPDLCKELEFIHKSCCTVGYRPSVFSTTLSHLIATNCAQLIMPIVPIRERIKEKVEEFFGCEYELVVEFTGLIRKERNSRDMAKLKFADFWIFAHVCQSPRARTFKSYPLVYYCYK